MTFAAQGQNKINATVTHESDGSVYFYPLPAGLLLSSEDAVKLAAYITASQPYLHQGATKQASG